MAKKSNDDVDFPSLDAYFKVLEGIQDQIRFADSKAAFIFAINTLMIGFVTCTVATVKTTIICDNVPPSLYVVLVALFLFVLFAVTAIGFLIYAVMSRFGALAPKSRVFFGHIASQFCKDYGKYVSELRAMSSDDWMNEIGTQIVEISHIAQAKHQAVKIAASLSLIGLAFWTITVFTSAFLSPV